MEQTLCAEACLCTDFFCGLFDRSFFKYVNAILRPPITIFFQQNSAGKRTYFYLFI
jgi:hypothetical protein